MFIAREGRGCACEVCYTCYGWRQPAAWDAGRGEVESFIAHSFIALIMRGLAEASVTQPCAAKVASAAASVLNRLGGLENFSEGYRLLRLRL